MREYRENNMRIIEIEDYLSIQEYMDKSNDINLDDVTFNVLWNSDRQCINKGFVFAFRVDEGIYNILVNDEVTLIDERVNVDGITEERFIRLSNSDEYSFSFLKHDASGSTFYTQYFSPKSDFTVGLQLQPKVAMDEIAKVIYTLTHVEGIENVLSIARLNNVIISDLKARIVPSL